MPVGRAPWGGGNIRVSPPSELRSGNAGEPVQILLIEDDVEAASHVSSGLREAGYTVKHCVDGASGLAAARAAARPLGPSTQCLTV